MNICLTSNIIMVRITKVNILVYFFFLYTIFLQVEGWVHIQVKILISFAELISK